MTQRVVVIPYDSRWAGLFAQVGGELRRALGTTALRIDHIGSTSVPGLDAKDIIDVQVSMVALEPVAAYREALASAGYVLRADNPELTKRYFREAPGQRRTHIHVRRAGSWAEQFALLFRDFLRVHAEDARAYAALKHRLAQQHATNRHGYTAAKQSFIWEIMKKADLWSQDTGWEPGAADL